MMAGTVSEGERAVMEIRGSSVMLASVLALPLMFCQPVAFAASDNTQALAETAADQQSFTLALEKAEAGDAKAQYDVARFYQTGKGIAPDHAKAVEWLVKAAEQGLMEAEASLGSAYDLGMGVPISNQKAVYWWQKAAKQGSGFALRCLGYSYIEGRGVAQNNLYAYVIWKQLPADDAEASDVLKALRKNLSAEETAKGDRMTLDEVFQSR